MTTYPTSAVDGDRKVAARALKPGDVLRMYNGIQDTATIARIVHHGAQQYGGERLTLVLECGTQIETRSASRHHLATGPARSPQEG